MSSAEWWLKVLAAPGDEQTKTRYVEELVQEGDRCAEAFLVGAEIRKRQENHQSHRNASLQAHLDALTQEQSAKYAKLTDAWQAKLTFVRGWPGELTISASGFAKHAAEMVAVLPLRHLNLSAMVEAPEVFHVPQFSQIASLRANGQTWSNAVVKALTGSPYLRDLRWLDLSKTGIGDKQVEMLAAAETLRRVEQIDLTKNPCRDPVDAVNGAGYDGITGHITAESIYLPEFGRELEQKYGRIRWLNVLYCYGDFPVSRYQF